MSKQTKDRTCGKCGREYDTWEEGFYWEGRVGNWRRPCKKCISDYNKDPERLKARRDYNREYFRQKREEDKKAGKRFRYDHRPRVGDAKR